MWQQDLLDWKPEPEPERQRAVRPLLDREAEQTDLCRWQIRLALEAGVPIQVAEFRAAGGLRPWHLKVARRFAEKLACEGDKLMFGSKKRGEVAEMMTELIFAVAIGALQPGGITVCGMHFEEYDERADSGDRGPRVEHGDEDQPAQLQADSVEG